MYAKADSYTNVELCATAKEGEFTVPLIALLPTTLISAPGIVHFQMCAAFDKVTVNFEVVNVG